MPADCNLRGEDSDRGRWILRDQNDVEQTVIDRRFRRDECPARHVASVRNHDIVEIERECRRVI